MSDAPPDAGGPSAWQLLRGTPLRDLVRLRLSRRLDVRWAVDRAGLPERSRGLVLEVVRRTRLWRLEKSDLGAELAAHFRDGLDAGATEDELIEKFGDARTAAKLIRRAKIRNRPWAWHAWRRGVQAVAALLVVYIAMAAWLATRHPTPSVDYLAKLNEPVKAIPEEDTAWPLYRRVWAEHPIPLESWEALEVPTEAGETRQMIVGDPGWERVPALLDAHAVWLDAAREGTRKRALGVPLGFPWEFSDEDRAALGLSAAGEPEYETRVQRLAGESLVSVLLPHLGPLRQSAKLLALDMQLAAQRGDGARVCDDYRAILGLARQAREQPLLVNQLVAISLALTADDALGVVLHRLPDALGEAELRDLAHESIAAEPNLRVDFAGERYIMLDTIQRMYSDDGKGDGTLTYDGMRYFRYLSGEPGEEDAAAALDRAKLAALPVVYFTAAGRREMTEQAERVYALMQRDAGKPLWVLRETDTEADRLIQSWRRSPRDRTRYFLLHALLPSLEAACVTAEAARGRREATRVALALETFRRRRGAYPADLTELAPAFLPELPPDRSTGGALRYRLVDGRPLLYGLGYDGMDDGGAYGDKRSVGRVPEKGDWVLFPPYAATLKAEE